MGIGGLDKEFSDIFRRAFASRVFPPDIVEQMGEKSCLCPHSFHIWTKVSSISTNFLLDDEPVCLYIKFIHCL